MIIKDCFILQFYINLKLPLLSIILKITFTQSFVSIKNNILTHYFFTNIFSYFTFI